MFFFKKIKVKVITYYYAIYYFFYKVNLKNVYVDLSTPKFLNSAPDGKILILSENIIHLLRERRLKNGTRLLLSGMFSSHNKDIDAIESMARMAPFLASLLYRKDISLQDKDFIQLCLNDLFLNASDLDKSYSWGVPKDYDQRLAEMADYALSLWLSREHIWNNYNYNQKTMIIEWLKTSSNCKYSDNNWHLFILTIEEVVNALTSEDVVDISRFNRISSFINDDGWFKDGENGDYDYYNAWAFYYSLYWLSLINPLRYNKFYSKNIITFSESYKYLIGSKGFPFFGRSACYKYAVTCPLLLTSLLNKEVISPEFALSRFNQIWNTYSVYEKNKNNLLSQGLFGSQSHVFDTYSGPGSALWSLRSSIIYNYNYNFFSDFSILPDVDLDCSINVFDIKIINSESFVTVINNNNCNNNSRIKKNNFLYKLLSFLFQKPFRSDYKKVLNSRRKFSSDNIYLK